MGKSMVQKLTEILSQPLKSSATNWRSMVKSQITREFLVWLTNKIQYELTKLQNPPIPSPFTQTKALIATNRLFKITRFGLTGYFRNSFSKFSGSAFWLTLKKKISKVILPDPHFLIIRKVKNCIHLENIDFRLS